MQVRRIICKVLPPTMGGKMITVITFPPIRVKLFQISIFILHRTKTTNPNRTKIRAQMTARVARVRLEVNPHPGVNLLVWPLLTTKMVNLKTVAATRKAAAEVAQRVKVQAVKRVDLKVAPTVRVTV
jgi:hypothetical protein